MTRRGWLFFGLLSVLWGIPYLFIKIAVSELSPEFLVFIRTTIAGLALLPIALAGGHFRGLRAVWCWVLAFTVLEIAVPWLMLGYAETRLSSSLTALLLAAIPMVALLVARAAGLEPAISTSRWIGLSIGIAGVAAVAGLDIPRGDAIALLAVAVVVIGYASAPVLVATKLPRVSGVGVTTVAMLLTATLYLPVGVFRHPVWTDVSPRVWGSVAVLSLVCSALAFVIFFRLVAEVGPARMSVITYVNPVVAAFAGVLVLHEPVTAGLVVGFPLVLAGSYLATRRPAAQTVILESAPEVDQLSG